MNPAADRGGKGFVAPVAVSPFTPGSVRATVMTTDGGMSTPIASPFWRSISTSFRKQNVREGAISSMKLSSVTRSVRAWCRSSG